MPMPNTGAPPAGAPVAAPGEDDPFAMFRKQIAGLDGPGKKKALQDFEDSMFQIMQDNLSDVYAEADAQDQPAPAPAQPPAAAAPEPFRSVVDDEESPIPSPQPPGEHPMRPGIDRMYTKEEATAISKSKMGGYDDSATHYDPEVMNQIIEELYDNGSLRGTPYDSYDFRERVGKILGPKANVEKGGEFPDERSINDAVNKAKRGYTPPTGLKPRPPSSRSIIDDPAAIDPPEGFDDVASPMKYQGAPPNSEMSPEEKNARGRVMFDKDGTVAEAADGYVDEDDPDLPYGASALPKGVMKGKPPPTEEEYGGKTDSWVTAMYRWEKDNGIEYGSPEYEQALKKAQRGNGRSTPLENDMEGMPKPRMSMMGRY